MTLIGHGHCLINNDFSDHVPTLAATKACDWLDFHRQNEGQHYFGLHEPRDNGFCGVHLPRLPWAAGDRLWVREAWRPSYGADWYREDLGRVPSPRDFDPKTTAIEYLADGERELGGKNRPGIHMPRWASRLTLSISTECLS